MEVIGSDHGTMRYSFDVESDIWPRVDTRCKRISPTSIGIGKEEEELVVGAGRQCKRCRESCTRFIWAFARRTQDTLHLMPNIIHVYHRHRWGIARRAHKGRLERKGRRTVARCWVDLRV